MVLLVMNAAQRKELKRSNESQQQWKAKAIERGKTIHFLKEKINELDKSRAHWREKAEDLKKKIILLPL
jgi:septal ring factor EnvC (AmiA/AmiB activator)